MERRQEEVMKEKEVQFTDTSYIETGQRGSMKRKGSTMKGRERAKIEAMRLYEAAQNGSVDFLNELMKEDNGSTTLTRVCFTCSDETPLHVASIHGHLDFVTTLLSHLPDLITELDSQGRSPLHLACVRGHVEIVKKLLLKNSDVCFLRDEDGRTPLHLAVMKGRVAVIDELVRAQPKSIWYNQDQGETILHSCVKHNRLEALRLLVESGRVDVDFINVKDDDGNTILHMATALKKIEIVKYLLSKGVKVNAVNANYFTALDIIEASPRDLKAMEIREFLLNCGASRTRNLPAVSACNNTDEVIRGNEISLTVASDVRAAGGPSPQISTKKNSKTNKEWFARKRNALMVAATVIATMAFQAGQNPPGGFFNDDVKNEDGTIKFKGGTPIMAEYDQYAFSLFCLFNSLAFSSSLSTVLLLVSGMPLKRRIVMWILTATMWVTISFMAATFLIMLLMENDYGGAVLSLLLWLALIVIILLSHVFRFLRWCVRKLLKLRKKRLSSNMTRV